MAKHYTPLKADEKPPAPPEGRRYVLFRPHGAKHLTANILMPDGYTETFKTGHAEGRPAVIETSKRVGELYRERKIESPAQLRARTGEVSEYMARKQRRDAEPNGAPTRALTTPIQLPLAEVEPPAQDEEWDMSLVRIENKMAQAFSRIQMLLLLGVGADDAETFRDHVRAIVVETTLAGVTPTGRIQRKRRTRATVPGRKRGRPPGS